MRMYRFQLSGDEIIEDSGEVERSPAHDGDGLKAYEVMSTTPKSQYFRLGYRWYDKAQNFSIDRDWALKECRSFIRRKMNECLESIELNKKALSKYDKSLRGTK
jgi:hypothetical protein